MRPPFSLLVALAVLSGCAAPGSASDSERTPVPDTRIAVMDGYLENFAAFSTLSVVLGEIVVSDSSAVEHIGGSAETMDETFRAFFAETLPTAFETARIGDVSVVDAAPRGLSTRRPADGVRFEDLDTDLVLLLDTVMVYSARIISYVPGSGVDPNTGRSTPGFTTTYRGHRIDAYVVLWDNRTGELVAAGRLDTEPDLSRMRMSQAAYEEAVIQFVENLGRHTPIAIRDRSTPPQF